MYRERERDWNQQTLTNIQSSSDRAGHQWNIPVESYFISVFSKSKSLAWSSAMPTVSPLLPPPLPPPLLRLVGLGSMRGGRTGGTRREGGKCPLMVWRLLGAMRYNCCCVCVVWLGFIVIIYWHTGFFFICKKYYNVLHVAKTLCYMTVKWEIISYQQNEHHQSLQTMSIMNQDNMVLA